MVSPSGNPAPAPKPRRGPPPRRLSHEAKVLLLSLASGFAGVLVSMIILWTGDYTPKVQWTLTLLVVGAWVMFALSVRENVMRPLQTLSNMQAALREGDYSLRVRSSRQGDSLAELMYEVNALAEAMREQRVGAMDASALLAKVMAEIDVAVFTFDEHRRLRLVNRAGERIMAQTAEHMLGYTAEELGLNDFLEGEAVRTIERSFPGGAGRYGMRRSDFRQGGVPHYLLVLTDLSRALREEEREAWQRLVRVLGHELNNSLAPIMSLSQSLEEIFRRPSRPPDWEDDMRRGLKVIAERSEALTRFMRDYARLARLPRPRFTPIPLETLVQRIAGFETRLKVQVEPGPPVVVEADADQLEQLIINLVKNATDASLDTGGGVHIGWSRNGHSLSLWVRDEGPGIANPANLFVPFFTTKPGGSGIGLALSRQIAEAHGGELTVSNRSGARGVEAHLRLPLKR
jgi:two-component system nitrogen regulation sensor histidine kinase NtrY